MNVAVIGSRTFEDYTYLSKVLDVIKHKIDHIVSGGARGADSLAYLYAENNGIKTIIYKAQWDKYGKGAGYIRNKLIIDDCDVVIAFWDGKSKGTKHSIDLATKQKKKVIIC